MAQRVACYDGTLLPIDFNRQCTRGQLAVKRRSTGKYQKRHGFNDRQRAFWGLDEAAEEQFGHRLQGVERGTRRKNPLEWGSFKQQNERTVFTYKGVDHIALVTKRLAAMKTFYTESLGLTLEQESKSKAGYNVVTLRAGESLIDLFEASPVNPAPMANLSEEHICLSATGSSIYDVIATFKRKGMDPSPAEVNNGSKGKGLSTWVRDPDGNKIEIKVD